MRHSAASNMNDSTCFINLNGWDRWLSLSKSIWPQGNTCSLSTVAVRLWFSCSNVLERSAVAHVKATWYKPVSNTTLRSYRGGLCEQQRLGLSWHSVFKEVLSIWYKGSEINTDRYISYLCGPLCWIYRTAPSIYGPFKMVRNICYTFTVCPGSITLLTTSDY